MNFAKNLMGKYGWKEGDGLGRDKNGITKPLKANYKFDNAGLGHNPADDMNNHWWENVYNKAATNLNVATNASNEVKVGLNNEQSVEITTKNYSVKSNQKNSSDYGGSFLKSATLTNEGHEVEFAHKQAISPVIMKIVSDEELFKACGGRTAHKGARHGLKLSGKLNRIEQQEQELINKIRSAKEDCSQVFKEYADCKSRYNKKKLKRLNKKISRKSAKSETVTSANMLSTAMEDETMEQKMEERVEETNESDERNRSEKSRKNKLTTGKVDKRSKRRHKKKLKKLAKEMHVSDSKDNFLKKMTIEELPISFESIKKSKKSRTSDVDDVSLHSYRCRDEQSQSDNDNNEVQANILSQLSEKLNKVKKKKQKVIVENLTEFQMEHLRNAHVPFVEIKQSSRRTSRKNEAKFNSLANNLVDKMSIL